jgi:hypothetical protein
MGPVWPGPLTHPPAGLWLLGVWGAFYSIDRLSPRHGGAKSLAKSGKFGLSAGLDNRGCSAKTTGSEARRPVRHSSGRPVRLSPVDAGPDDVQRSAGLGPISPELALVDPELSERARNLLPDPPARPRRPLPLPRVEVAAEPVAPPRKPHRRRTVVLAALVFAAGAVSGSFLAGRHGSSPGVTFEARAGAPPPPPPRVPAGKKPVTQRTSTGSRPAHRPPGVSTNSRSVQRPPGVSTNKRRRQTTSTRRRRPRTPRVTWAANVLGVTARVGRPGVTIVWQRPRDSAHVVVLRTRGARRHGVAVFRGRAASYRDASARPCTAYRYTIVNYDRRGHRSTGVPTSVWTGGCT